MYDICIIMWHSHLNDVEIPETKRFIPKGCELGTTSSYPHRSITWTIIFGIIQLTQKQFSFLER